MLDFFKLFFSSLHSLPPFLRYTFVFLFFTTAVVVTLAFRRWLEGRQMNKEMDLWASVPVDLAVGQAILWGLWATASFYAVYVAEPSVAKVIDPATPNRESGRLAAAAASVKVPLKNRKEQHHGVASIGSRKATALPDAHGGRSGGEIMGAEVVPGAKSTGRSRTRSGKSHASSNAAMGRDPSIPDTSVVPLPELAPTPASHAAAGLSGVGDSHEPMAPPQAAIPIVPEGSESVSDKGAAPRSEGVKHFKRSKKRAKTHSSTVAFSHETPQSRRYTDPATKTLLSSSSDEVRRPAALDGLQAGSDAGTRADVGGAVHGKIAGSAESTDRDVTTPPTVKSAAVVDNLPAEAATKPAVGVNATSAEPANKPVTAVDATSAESVTAPR